MFAKIKLRIRSDNYSARFIFRSVPSCQTYMCKYGISCVPYHQIKKSNLCCTSYTHLGVFLIIHYLLRWYLPLKKKLSPCSFAKSSLNKKCSWKKDFCFNKWHFCGQDVPRSKTNAAPRCLQYQVSGVKLSGVNSVTLRCPALLEIGMQRNWCSSTKIWETNC